MKKIKHFCLEFKVLLRSVPALILTCFIISLLAMNLLANKSLNLPFDWLALDCGIIVSWVAFLCMDIMTKHFGPRAATYISILGVIINLFVCLIFFIASKIPGVWGAFFDYGEAEVINTSLDATFGGTWYVLLGSTVAFIASAIINNFTNFGIGKIFKKNPNGFCAYALRTYLSTAIAQFVDNMVFALIVSHFFFGWTLLQCVTCSLTGMVVELLCEVIFSPIGYKVCTVWKAQGVGREYFEFLEKSKEN